LLSNQLALRLCERRFGLRYIGAGDFTDTEAVLGCFELLAQDIHIIAVNFEQRLVAHHVEICHRDGLENRGLDRQRLRPRRFDSIDCLPGLRHRPAAAVDRLRRLELHQIWSGLDVKAIGGGRREGGLERRGTVADLAGEIDRRTPK